MTYLLDQAFKAAKALPEPEQDAIAAAILAEIQNEHGGGAGASALLSEAALADWSREEEDAAWAHLQ